jgi:hypothetical protein
MKTEIAKILSNEITKSDISTFVNKIKNQLINGEITALELFTKIQGIKKTIEAIEKVAKDKALEEAFQYGKMFTIRNCEFTVVYRNSFDFTHDDMYNRLTCEIKERQDMLKSISKPIADPDTGEIIYPALRKQTEYLTVKLK